MRGWIVLIACCIVPAVTAAAATPFDGVYRGSRTVEGVRNRRCDTGQALKIAVVDGQFKWAVVRGQPTPVPIAADGSFNGRSGRRFIEGRIEGGTLTAHTKGEYCDYGWSLQR